MGRQVGVNGIRDREVCDLDRGFVHVVTEGPPDSMRVVAYTTSKGKLFLPAI